MKVRATQPGYYGSYRMPGDEFVIRSEADFSDTWMKTAKPGRGRPQRTPSPPVDPPQSGDDATTGDDGGGGGDDGLGADDGASADPDDGSAE